MTATTIASLDLCSEVHTRGSALSRWSEVDTKAPWRPSLAVRISD
jgi:hypothetical protein